MPSNNPATIAERLAAAGLRVRPLVWRRKRGSAQSGPYNVLQTDKRTWYAETRFIELHEGTRAECIAACDRHNVAGVLAMLEPIPSEEPPQWRCDRPKIN